MAYLHDIATVRDIRMLPARAERSAEEAQALLAERGYDAGCAERVVACILRHSSPLGEGETTPEEVCVSNADAMAQIANPPYWLFFAYRIMGMEFAVGKAWYAEKVRSNWAALTTPLRTIIETRYHLAEGPSKNTFLQAGNEENPAQ